MSTSDLMRDDAVKAAISNLSKSIISGKISEISERDIYVEAINILSDKIKKLHFAIDNSLEVSYGNF